MRRQERAAEDISLNDMGSLIAAAVPTKIRLIASASTWAQADRELAQDDMRPRPYVSSDRCRALATRRRRGSDGGAPFRHPSLRVVALPETRMLSFAPHRRPSSTLPLLGWPQFPPQ